MNTLTRTKKQAESPSARASWPAWLNSNTIALLIGMATIGLTLGAMMQTSYSRLENSIEMLRNEVGTLRQEMRLEIREVRDELRREFRQEIGSLRDELRAFDGRLRSVETDVAAIKASLGTST